MSDSDQEIAFRFAVDRVNSDRTVLPNTRLTAQIERIPQQDSFYAAKQGNERRRRVYNLLKTILCRPNKRGKRLCEDM